MHWVYFSLIMCMYNGSCILVQNICIWLHIYNLIANKSLINITFWTSVLILSKIVNKQEDGTYTCWGKCRFSNWGILLYKLLPNFNSTFVTTAISLSCDPCTPEPGETKRSLLAAWWMKPSSSYENILWPSMHFSLWSFFGTFSYIHVQYSNNKLLYNLKKNTVLGSSNCSTFLPLHNAIKNCKNTQTYCKYSTLIHYQKVEFRFCTRKQDVINNYKINHHN